MILLTCKFGLFSDLTLELVYLPTQLCEFFHLLLLLLVLVVEDFQLQSTSCLFPSFGCPSIFWFDTIHSNHVNLYYFWICFCCCFELFSAECTMTPNKYLCGFINSNQPIFPFRNYLSCTHLKHLPYFCSAI